MWFGGFLISTFDVPLEFKDKVKISHKQNPRDTYVLIAMYYWAPSVKSSSNWAGWPKLRLVVLATPSLLSNVAEAACAWFWFPERAPAPFKSKWSP